MIKISCIKHKSFLKRVYLKAWTFYQSANTNSLKDAPFGNHQLCAEQRPLQVISYNEHDKPALHEVVG